MNEPDNTSAGAGPGRVPRPAVFLVRAYMFVAVLFGAAQLTPALNAGLLLALALVLAVPAALALWHRAVVRCLLSLHQFQPGRALHWIGSRLVLRKALGAVLALLVSYSSILHSTFFGVREWMLLALMPAVFTAARSQLASLLRPQLTGSVYATHATLRLAGWAVALVYLLGWVGLTVVVPDTAPGGLVERIEALQAPWTDAPAASARHAVCALAWAAAASDTANALSQAPMWRVAVGMLAAPLSTVVFVTLAMQGLALPAAEVRRNFSPGPSGDDVSPPIPSAAAGAYAAIIVLLLLILFPLAAHVEQALKAVDCPFAVSRLPECEAIDGKVYKLGTLASIAKVLAAGTVQVGHARASACAELDSAQAAAAKPIDAYLDWYFSLPAEWMRTWKMLTGDLEQMLRDRLTESLESDPGLAQALALAQGASRAQADALDALLGKVSSMLGDNVLVLDERSCKVVRRDSIAQTLAAREGESLRLRTIGSAGAGLAVGAVAGKVAAAAMTKGSMKSAVKVLAKFIGKKTAAVSLPTIAGMAVGSVPGAVVGAVVGFLISGAVDWAALEAEEYLARDAMKAELLEAFQEELASARTALGCVP